MKKFFLVRTEDINGNSGLGVVAEGIVFDTGLCAMTWLSDISTVTIYRKITDVEKLHGHGGRTKVVIEGRKRQANQFQACLEEVREKLWLNKREVK